MMTFCHRSKAERSHGLGRFRVPSTIRNGHCTAVSLAVLLGLMVLTLGFAALAAEQTIPVPLNVMRYAQHLIDEYDANGDGVLQPEEWKEMRGDPSAADANGDGLIDVHELARYIADYGSARRIRLTPEALDRLPPLLYDVLAAGDSVPLVPEAISKPVDMPSEEEAVKPSEQPGQKQFTVKPSRLPPGLPAWFHELDADGDGQITLSEFAPTGSAAAIREFEAYDHNRDGVITPQEAAAGPKRLVREPTDDE